MPEWAFYLVMLPAAVGFLIPPRAARWTIAGTAGVVALAWLPYDGSFHNWPWPFLLTPVAAGLIAGIAIRLLQARLMRTHGSRAEWS